MSLISIAFLLAVAGTNPPSVAVEAKALVVAYARNADAADKR